MTVEEDVMVLIRQLTNLLAQVQIGSICRFSPAKDC
jgi:hypothetical protein